MRRPAAVLRAGVVAYALYSFDYRWSLARARLPDRIHLFQTHSAFFLGTARWWLALGFDPGARSGMRGALMLSLLHDACKHPVRTLYVFLDARVNCFSVSDGLMTCRGAMPFFFWRASAMGLRQGAHVCGGAGFGCVCTVSTCCWPFFTQAAVIAMIYPLFILVACKSDPLAAYKRGTMLDGSISSTLKFMLADYCCCGLDSVQLKAAITTVQLW